MPHLYTKPKIITAKERNNRPVKSLQSRSKKKLPRKLLVRQQKQEKENKSSRKHLTLNERFNMLEMTDDLKKICPGVKRKYSTYQPMTDAIYSRWERRTRSLNLQSLDADTNQQNLIPLDVDTNRPNLITLDTDGTRPKPKAVSSANSSIPEIMKLPVCSSYTFSPLPLPTDADTISTGDTSNLARSSDKRSASISYIDTTDTASRRSVSSSNMDKDTDSLRNWSTQKGANIKKARNRELMTSRCQSVYPDLIIEEGSRSPAFFGPCPSTEEYTSGSYLLFDKKKAWNRSETEVKNTKPTRKGLLFKKVNLSILSATFGQTLTNENVSKSIHPNIMHRSGTSRDILWHSQ